MGGRSTGGAGLKKFQGSLEQGPWEVVFILEWTLPEADIQVQAC